MYDIVFKKSAEKDLSKVNIVYYETVENHIGELANNPRPVGCKKIAGSVHSYRIRVGVYRIIYTIEDNKLIVEVIKIGHRRDVYNK